MLQIVSLIGAALLLIAFGLSQTGRMSNSSLIYASLNLVGALCILASAIVPLNPGVVVMEVAWSMVSLVSLWRGLVR